MSDEWVRLEVSDGVGLVTMDRKPVNALNRDMRRRYESGKLHWSCRADRLFGHLGVGRGCRFVSVAICPIDYRNRDGIDFRSI